MKYILLMHIFIAKNLIILTKFKRKINKNKNKNKINQTANLSHKNQQFTNKRNILTLSYIIQHTKTVLLHITYMHTHINKKNL